MDRTETPSSNQSQPGEQSKKGEAGEIDMQELAERVYRLMQADLRLTRARGASSVRRKQR